MSIHSSTYKGKRVFLRMKDKTTIVDKFVEKKSGKVVLEEHGKVLISDIVSMSIFKNKGDE